jgi:hypothetical protein
MSANPLSCLRAVRLAVSLSALAFAVALFCPGGIHAGVVPASSGTVTLTSEPGDYVGGGQSWSYDAQIDRVLVGAERWGTARVFVYAANGDFWALNFTAPAGAPLSPGVYTDAQRAFDDFHPGLDVSGMGRGCNDLTGSFTVLAVSYGPYGYLQSLHATFEQRCGTSTAALRGEIDVVAPPAPAPIGVTVTVDSDATVDRADGLVHLHGTIACSTPVRAAGLSGDLTQVQKKGTATGFFNQVSVADCDSTAKAWDATTTLSSELRFSAGSMTVQVRAAAIDDFYTNYFGFPYITEVSLESILNVRNG